VAGSIRIGARRVLNVWFGRPALVPSVSVERVSAAMGRSFEGCRQPGAQPDEAEGGGRGRIAEIGPALLLDRGEVERRRRPDHVLERVDVLQRRHREAELILPDREVEIGGDEFAVTHVVCQLGIGRGRLAQARIGPERPGQRRERHRRQVRRHVEIEMARTGEARGIVSAQAERLPGSGRVEVGRGRGALIDLPDQLVAGLRHFPREKALGAERPGNRLAIGILFEDLRREHGEIELALGETVEEIVHLRVADWPQEQSDPHLRPCRGRAEGSERPGELERCLVGIVGADELPVRLGPGHQDRGDRGIDAAQRRLGLEGHGLGELGPVDPDLNPLGDQDRQRIARLVEIGEAEA
jgi:hypothetical protein